MVLKLYQNGKFYKINKPVNPPVTFINGQKKRLIKGVTFVNGVKKILWGKIGITLDQIVTTGAGLNSSAYVFWISENMAWITDYSESVHKVNIQNPNKVSDGGKLYYGQRINYSSSESNATNSIFYATKNENSASNNANGVYQINRIQIKNATGEISVTRASSSYTLQTTNAKEGLYLDGPGVWIAVVNGRSGLTPTSPTVYVNNVSKYTVPAYDANVTSGGALTKFDSTRFLIRGTTSLYVCDQNGIVQTLTFPGTIQGVLVDGNNILVKYMGGIRKIGITGTIVWDKGDVWANQAGYYRIAGKVETYYAIYCDAGKGNLYFINVSNGSLFKTIEVDNNTLNGSMFTPMISYNGYIGFGVSINPWYFWRIHVV